MTSSVLSPEAAAGKTYARTAPACIEALKAQAVAARSYALATRQIGAPFDVYSDTRSQMYLGIASETPAKTSSPTAKTC